MPEILITVKDKLPVITGEVRSIVANNSDYTIRFVFDEQWSEGEKKVFFIRSNGYAFAPVMTAHDVAEVPAQYDVKKISHLWVGVQQGDIKTSAPLVIPLRSSVTELIDDEAVQPEPDMWQDHENRLKKLEEHGGGGTGTVTSVAGVEPDENGNVPLTAGDIGAASMEDIDALKEAKADKTLTSDDGDSWELAVESGGDLVTHKTSGEVEIVAESLESATLADKTLALTGITGTYGAVIIPDASEISIDVPANVEKYPYFADPAGWQNPSFGWFLLRTADGYITVHTTNYAEVYRVSADLKTWTSIGGAITNVAQNTMRVVLDNGTATVYSDDVATYTVGGITGIGYCASGVKVTTIYGVTVIHRQSAGGVLTEAEKQEIAEMAAELVEVPDGGGIDVTGAAVGQTIVVKAVNDNGTPTEWEAVDFPTASGGAWKKIAETITVSGGDDGATGMYAITPTLNSNDNWTEAIIQCSIKTDSTTTKKHRINWLGDQPYSQYLPNVTISTSAVVLRMHITNVGDRLYVNSYDSNNAHGSEAISNSNGLRVGLYLHWSTIAAGETITSDGVVYYR